MVLGTACEPHRVPLQFCAACKATQEERDRIMPIARAAHPAIHNESPRPMCPVCIMITRIEPQQ